MKKNMGSFDVIIRIVLATVIAVLFYTQIISGTFGIVLLVVAAVLMLTSFFSFCPFYLPFGINTFKTKSK